MRMLRDVTVQQAHDDEFVVIGREAGIVGEAMTIEVAEPSTSIDVQVTVMESVPVIVDGAVRHRLRLLRTSAAVLSEAQAENGPQNVLVPEETR